MQWIVGHRSELRLIIIYIWYWNVVDSLQQNVESTSKLGFKRANTPMGPNDPCSKLIYHDDRVYEGQIGSRFILEQKAFW